MKSPKAYFLIQIHPWNVATPLIRTLSLVPRVAGLEEFHCIALKDAQGQTISSTVERLKRYGNDMHSSYLKRLNFLRYSEVPLYTVQLLYNGYIETSKIVPNIIMEVSLLLRSNQYTKYGTEISVLNNIEASIIWRS